MGRWYVLKHPRAPRGGIILPRYACAGRDASVTQKNELLRTTCRGHGSVQAAPAPPTQVAAASSTRAHPIVLYHA